MVRNFILIIVVLSALLAATVFAALNPGTMTLDLAFRETELPISLAMSAAFGIGWLFGLLCAGVILYRAISERRKLRRSLTIAEAEVKALRSMPIQDAD